MNLSPELIQEAERRFGVPREIELVADLDSLETELVAGSMRRLRVHDVTLFIIEGPDIAVIRKPMFPVGVYRAPSGGVAPGETLEEGALREGLEETGLRVELERYVLRVVAAFSTQAGDGGAASLPTEVTDPDDPSILRWWSHVFLARAVGEDLTLDPQDTHEIAEARWVGIDELQGPIRRLLLESGSSLLRYRVQLTDATLAELGLASAIMPRNE
jgi:ADP-ribose pyrophosphatase YjhB (NUDIX family)